MIAAASADIEDCLNLAMSLAEAARGPALKYFRSQTLRVDNKLAVEGDFDPVTIADREVEAVIREILARERPSDGVIGEEHANTDGTSGISWVIDPIDGTRSFLCGLPTWGVLIAMNDGVRPVIGVMDQPLTTEQYVGVMSGDQSRAFLRHSGVDTPLHTRSCKQLSDALMCSTAPTAFSTVAERNAFEALSQDVRLTRFGTDCYGYAMLALGQIDLVVESGLSAYDIQAMIPIVQGAGGAITDWHGGDCQEGGRVVAAGDPELHALAVAYLSDHLG